MTAPRKCLIWDLDDTLWDGVCLEQDVRVRAEVVETITELDRRGILQSIASRGDAELSSRMLELNGLAKFFLAPQINWLPKSQNIIRISQELGISLEAIAFIDDDPFEREQVSYMLPDVMTLDAQRASDLPTLTDFSPVDITPEARNRRQLYLTEMERSRAESEFASREDFLTSCGMKLTVRPLAAGDIPRVLELLTRTHQLNTTGLTVERSELERIYRSPSATQQVTVAELRDRFGGYGVIGVAIAESERQTWRLTMFAVSCRVMGRGVERAFMTALVRAAHAGGCSELEAAYRDTGRNRMMRALYQMMGFRAGALAGEPRTLLFRTRVEELPESPRWVEVE